MKLSLKNSLILAGLAMVAAPLVTTQSASAQPVRFNGSYVGAGVSGGVTSSGLPGGERTFGGNITARLTTDKAPVSLRGQVLFANTNSAIVPTLTYDYAVTDKVNIYGGAGYSFVQKQGQTSPIGNRNAVVLNAGVESEVAKGIVVYGDAKYGINGYVGGKPGVALSGGVGLKF